MAIEATTDGEKMIQLDGKMDSVLQRLDKLLEYIDKLETIKITNLEAKVTELEKWKSEWQGFYKVVVILSGAISLAVGAYTMFKR